MSSNFMKKVLISLFLLALSSSSLAYQYVCPSVEQYKAKGTSPNISYSYTYSNGLELSTGVKPEGAVSDLIFITSSANSTDQPPYGLVCGYKNNAGAVAPYGANTMNCKAVNPSYWKVHKSDSLDVHVCTAGAQQCAITCSGN